MIALATSRVFLISVAGFLVAVSLLAAVEFREPELFSASGALMIIAGTMLTARRLLRLGYEAYVLDKQSTDGGEEYGNAPAVKKADLQFREDEKAFQWSLPLLVMGTLIWAYGSLALRWLGYAQI